MTNEQIQDSLAALEEYKKSYNKVSIQLRSATKERDELQERLDAAKQVLDSMTKELADERDEALSENARLQQWINDLQAGNVITCVYCGHNYGPDSEVPTCMADVLKEHVQQCPKHPMSKLRKALEVAEGALKAIRDTDPLSALPFTADAALAKIYSLTDEAEKD